MPENTVILFGAGATKACGGILTNEILPEACRLKSELDREGMMEFLEQFLIENFNLPTSPDSRSMEDYPPLPLLFSLIDIAIEKGHPLSDNWDRERLTRIQPVLAYAIWAVLDYRGSDINNLYEPFLKLLNSETGGEFTLISLNYDLLADIALIRLSEALPQGLSFPDYRCDIATAAYREKPKFGELLKLHGSFNWLYCPNCLRLDMSIHQPGSKDSLRALDELYGDTALQDMHSLHGIPCPECGNVGIGVVVITPTHLKDYRNPHITRVWYEAGRALRRANRVIIVGYSTPVDDIDVIYLLKHNLSHLDPSRITVVEYSTDPCPLREHPVGRRYRALFGDAIDWRTTGFQGLISEQSARGRL